MLSGLRTIFLETTLRWPPLEGYTIKKEAIRGLFNKVFDPGGYRYENLELQADATTLSTKYSSGGQSVCRFGPDSLTIQEKTSPNTSLEGFVEAVMTVLGGLNQDEVPPFFVQQCKVECLAQPSNVENSLVLLAARAACVYDSIEPFARPPSHFGIRFRFQPTAVVETGTIEHHDSENIADQPSEAKTENQDKSLERVRQIEGFVAVRFETYAKDVSQVWMEVTASYPAADRPYLLSDTTKMANNIRETHQFLVDRSKRFLDQFDTKSDDDRDLKAEGQ